MGRKRYRLPKGHILMESGYPNFSFMFRKLSVIIFQFPHGWPVQTMLPDLCRHMFPWSKREYQNSSIEWGLGLKMGSASSSFFRCKGISVEIVKKEMVEEPETMSTDTIVAIRYGFSSIMQSAAEVIAYGTAVRFR